MVDLWLERVNLIIVFISLMTMFLLNRHIVIDNWTKCEFLLYHLIISLPQLVDLEFFNAMLLQQSVDNVGYFLFLAKHLVCFFIDRRLECIFIGLSLSYQLPVLLFLADHCFQASVERTQIIFLFVKNSFSLE